MKKFFGIFRHVIFRECISSLGFALVLISLCGGPAFAQACPLCKLSLLHSPEGRHIAKAFNDGILFLLAMPYLVGGTLALSIFWWRRRKEMTGDDRR